MTRRFSIIAVLLLALVGFSTRVYGVERIRKIDGTLEEKYSIYYKCDSIDVNPTYLDNPEQIERIIHYIEKSPRIDSIVINAYASPEGGQKYNQWLSLERAKTAKRLLLSYSPDSLKLNSLKIKINPCGENWGGVNTLCIK